MIPVKGERKGDREIGVEAARILGCMTVICCHVLPYSLNGTEGAFPTVLLRVLCADGVAVFWLITGMFLFAGRPFKYVLGRACRRIVLPLVLLSVLAFLSGGFRMGGSVSYTIPSAGEALRFFSSVLSLKNPVRGLDHTWFLYTYLWIVFLYPVLNSFTEYLNGDRIWMKRMMVLIPLFLLLNDMTENKLASFSNDSVNSMFAASVFLVAGHILNANRKDLPGGINVALCLLIPAIVAPLRAAMILRLTATEHLYYWYTFSGFLSAFFILCACLKLLDEKAHRIPASVCRWIRRFSSCTFGIYLIHVLPVYALVRLDAFEWIRSLFPDAFPAVSTAVTVWIVSLFVFLLSFFVVSSVQSFCRFVRRIFRTGKKAARMGG